MMPNYNYPYQANYNYPVMPQQQPQMQTNGFVSVRSIDEARVYPVAPGNSITFKIENSPYLCTKTMGFSQLEQPKFEKFKLVKEEEEVTPVAAEPVASQEDIKKEIEHIQVTIDVLKDRLSEVEKILKKRKKADEVEA